MGRVGVLSVGLGDDHYFAWCDLVCLDGKLVDGANVVDLDLSARRFRGEPTQVGVREGRSVAIQRYLEKK